MGMVRQSLTSLADGAAGRAMTTLTGARPMTTLVEGGGGPLAPIITVNEPVTNPPTFQVQFSVLNGDPYDTVPGDFVEVEVTDGAGTTYAVFTSDALTQDNIDNQEIVFDTSAETFAGGPLAETQMRIKRVNGSTIYSPWSNIESYTMPSLFTPADLFGSGEKGGWWDFSDTDELFQSNARTTAVASASDPIGYCGDKSGNDNHMVSSANDTTRPTYASGGGGVFVSSNFTRLSMQMSAAITDTTVFAAMVLKPTTGGADNKRYLSFSDSTGPDYNNAARAAAINYQNDPLAEGYRVSALSQKAVAVNSLNLVETKFDATNHTMTVNESDGTPTASTGSFNFDYVAIGAQARNLSGDHGDVTVMECIVINRIPTSGELASLRSYFNDKWSIY